MRLRRVTWWTLVQVALLALAAWTVLAAIGGLDHGQLRETLDGASWWWVAVVFVIAQLPWATQAVSTLGSVPARLALRPVYVMQLATSYMNLALPSSLARMAINIRFFQRQGIPPTAAVTAGAIDSFASTVIQAVLLVVLLVFSSASLNLSFDTRQRLAAARGGRRRARRRFDRRRAARAAAAEPDRRPRAHVVAGGARRGARPARLGQARPAARRQPRARSCCSRSRSASSRTRSATTSRSPTCW